jgi:hypothetical protein
VAAALPEPPDLAMVHHPDQAGPLDGVLPLVLAGHVHERRISTLDEGTLLMVQGSTGGAGLRALEGEYPEPLTCTVLYLDPETGELRAYDEIVLGGLGETEVTIQRFVLPLLDPDAESPDDGAAGSPGAQGEAVPEGPAQDGPARPAEATAEAPASPAG